MSKRKDVLLVAGGGIGGCAVALTLARLGYEVQLLEQAEALREIGAGIQLGPNAFRMFDSLGISDEVRAKLAYPGSLVMRDGLSGEEVTRMSLGQPFLARFGQPYALIYRADLHAILVQACEATPSIHVRTRARVVGFEQDPNGVTALLEDGTQERGCALIGCDGLWSKVRAQLLGDGPPRISGHIAYRAVLPVSEVPEELRWNDMVLWAGPRNHLVQYPLRGGELFNLVAVFHSDRYVEGWDAKADPQELHSRFAQNCAAVRTMLGRIETWRMWVLCDRDPVKSWSRGRVTLLGDAAHPMLQYMAQGACMALEDAIALAREVEMCPEALPEAFLAYERGRYLRTGRVQLTARLYGEVYHAHGVARELRNQMLSQRTQEQAYESLAWLYDDR